MVELSRRRPPKFAVSSPVSVRRRKKAPLHKNPVLIVPVIMILLWFVFGGHRRDDNSGNNSIKKKNNNNNNLSGVAMTPRKPQAVVLDQRRMELALQAAKLSNYTYETHPQQEADYYRGLTFFTDEPDQALVGSINGYCYAAFRGTTLTWSDWQQNFDPREWQVCGSGAQQCCTTRYGFYDAYNTTYRNDLERAIRDCVRATCDGDDDEQNNKKMDECVVFTGHSQGGAVAAVAALAMSDLNPYVITFGQPVTVNAPCPLIASERWYRFINTKSSEAVGITYDPVSFVPGLGADSFGHMMILGKDPTGLAYIGLDAQDFFGPLNVVGFEAHSIVGTDEHPGYLDRLESLMKSKSYPIRTNGFADGSLCSEHKECKNHKCERDQMFSFNRCIGTACKEDTDCPATGRCDTGACMPKLGSCMDCNEDSDCVSNKCLLFKCTNPDSGLMDNHCACVKNDDCASARCEGTVPPQCKPQLPVGARCNESSDCITNHCNWRFECAIPTTEDGTDNKWQ